MHRVTVGELKAAIAGFQDSAYIEVESCEFDLGKFYIVDVLEVSQLNKPDFVSIEIAKIKKKKKKNERKEDSSRLR